MGQPLKWKLLIEDNLVNNLDDKLFLVICFTAYHALMQMGESVVPDNPKNLNFCKLMLRRTVKFSTKNSRHL